MEKETIGRKKKKEDGSFLVVFQLLLSFQASSVAIWSLVLPVVSIPSFCAATTSGSFGAAAVAETPG